MASLARLGFGGLRGLRPGHVARLVRAASGRASDDASAHRPGPAGDVEPGAGRLAQRGLGLACCHVGDCRLCRAELDLRRAAGTGVAAAAQPAGAAAARDAARLGHRAAPPDLSRLRPADGAGLCHALQLSGRLLLCLHRAAAVVAPDLRPAARFLRRRVCVGHADLPPLAAALRPGRYRQARSGVHVDRRAAGGGLGAGRSAVGGGAVAAAMADDFWSRRAAALRASRGGRAVPTAGRGSLSAVGVLDRAGGLHRRCLAQPRAAGHNECPALGLDAVLLCRFDDTGGMDAGSAAAVAGGGGRGGLNGKAKTGPKAGSKQAKAALKTQESRKINVSDPIHGFSASGWGR